MRRHEREILRYLLRDLALSPAFRTATESP